MVDDKLYINGEEQHELYLQGMKEEYRENGLNYTADFGPVKVPRRTRVRHGRQSTEQRGQPRNRPCSI